MEGIQDAQPLHAASATDWHPRAHSNSTSAASPSVLGESSGRHGKRPTEGTHPPTKRRHIAEGQSRSPYSLASTGARTAFPSGGDTGVADESARTTTEERLPSPAATAHQFTGSLKEYLPLYSMDQQCAIEEAREFVTMTMGYHDHHPDERQFRDLELYKRVLDVVERDTLSFLRSTPRLTGCTTAKRAATSSAVPTRQPKLSEFGRSESRWWCRENSTPIHHRD